MLWSLLCWFGFHSILQKGETGMFNGLSLQPHVVNLRHPEHWRLLPIHYLGSLLFIYGRWCRLPRTWHATGGSRSCPWVEEGGTLQCGEDAQSSRPDPHPRHARSLLLRHFLEFCSQLLRVHTRWTLPTYWDTDLHKWLKRKTYHMYTDTCIHARHIKQILVHTSLKLDMVLQGLWVLRVRQHIKVAVWIHTGNLRWYITQWNLAVMCHRVIVLHMKGRGMEKRKQERGEERGCTRVCRHQIAAKHQGSERRVNDDRCNSQSHTELRLCTRLAHDALHFFVCLCCQRNPIPLQHLHSCIEAAATANRDLGSVRALLFSAVNVSCQFFTI